jgi:two-component system OmpR family response regulator
VTKVLIVEDDELIAEGMAQHLTAAGLDPVRVGAGEVGLARLRHERPDVLVLDLMLPGLDGWSLIEKARAEGIGTPIIVVSARGTEHDRVHALQIGADDYLVKPFSLAELGARLRALVRRGPIERPTVLAVGDLRLDPATRRVWRGDAEVELSGREYALLEAFMRRPGQVLTRYDLLERVWDYDYENRSNVVDVYVRYLREKIDRPFGAESIETVRGAGYRLCEPANT